MLAAKPDFGARGTAGDLRDALSKEVKKDLDAMMQPKKKSPPQLNRCEVITGNAGCYRNDVFHFTQKRLADRRLTVNMRVSRMGTQSICHDRPPLSAAVKFCTGN